MDWTNGDFEEDTIMPKAVGPEVLIAGMLELATLRARLQPRPSMREAASIGHRINVILLGGI